MTCGELPDSEVEVEDEEEVSESEIEEIESESEEEEEEEEEELNDFERRVYCHEEAWDEPMATEVCAICGKTLDCPPRSYILFVPSDEE